MGADTQYQLYEVYYQKATEAERQGLAKEAKTLYLKASELLLKSAKQADGEMKVALVKRAEKIQRIADLIEIQEENAYPSDGHTDSGMKHQGQPAGSKEAQDGGQRSWTSSGKPDVHFSDIAGLSDVKDSILHRIILPRKYPEIYERFKRKVSGGILLYGPPGTGKTMMAKAIACEVDAAFYSVQCSDIVSKYFGESEKNIKSLFDSARKEKTAVIFLDEFEALGAKRDGESSVMSRLVPELLSQMDGFQTVSQNHLMFLAATNRPWDIDSAFLRPPRFTEKIYVGLPDEPARLFLIGKAFQGVPVDPAVDFTLIAEDTEGYNAADVVAFCGAMKDSAIDRSIHNNDGFTGMILPDDAAYAKEKVKSSVQKQDIEMFARWRKEQGE